MVDYHRSTPAVVGMLAAVAMGLSAPARAHSAHVKPSDWAFSLGVGLLAAPNYSGDDAEQLILAPSVRATDGAHWTISFLEGVQYTVNPENNWRWGVAVAPSLGRDDDGDSPLRILGDGTDDLIGLGDTESAVSLRLFTQYKVGAWSMHADLQQTFTDKTQSLFSTGIRRSERVLAIGRPLIVSTGIRLRAGDQNTLATLVGVTPEQSITSGLATYRPDGGLIALGINGTVILPLSRSLSLLSTLSVERLSDELADSSLVSSRGDPLQASVGIFLNYQLGAEKGRP